MELPITADALAGLVGEAERVVLLQTPDLFFGVKNFAPGEVFANHYHEGFDEFFAGLEGRITIWEGRSSRFELTPGTSLLCRRGSHHYLVNETDEPARLAYVKVPMVDDDTVWVDWTPPSRAGA